MVARAVYMASCVGVLCPKCNEWLPSPTDGSDIWLADDFDKANGVVTCGGCDAKVTVKKPKQVKFVG